MIIAFDGPSGAGKSTLIERLRQDSANALVVAEKHCDPLRPVTEQVYRVANGLEGQHSFDDLVSRLDVPCSLSPQQLRSLRTYALEYCSVVREEAREQAFLAYLFTYGRTFTDTYVRALSHAHDVLLDRWQLSGWAGQSVPGHRWEEIRTLNDSMGIVSPSVQCIVMCEPAELLRRHRQRVERGEQKPHQLTEDAVARQCDTYLAIWARLSRKGACCTMVVTDLVDVPFEPYDTVRCALEQADHRFSDNYKPYQGVGAR